jgi:hypothetical protein
MKTDERPYSGTWSEDIQNKYRTVVSWTPDVIVQFNGDTTLPGCPECKNRIDFSSFITAVSIGSGIQSSSASCSIDLIIPKSFGDVVYRDGKFILTTGIEVNVYYRGFFKTDQLSLKNDVVELFDTKEDGSTERHNVDLNKIQNRPYYPVFHGFIKGVSITLNDNAYQVSIRTGNMLSLWDSQMINTQQGFFAANPKEARGSVNLMGHVYTNMTPHQIIYDLFRDTGGSPEGTNFVLQQKTNLTGKVATGQQFYSLYLRYLENRFSNGLYGLKMFGASGRAYTTFEQSILVDNTPAGRDNEYKKVVKRQLKPHTVSKRNSSSALSNMMKAGFIAQDPQGRVLRTLDVRQLPSILGGKEDAVNVLSLQEFITDINSLGQVSFYESQFTSKMSLANQVSEKIGYEFYQDLDGDLIFKPPMYNMDTSNDRVYRINREDTLTISYEHNEPEYTYVICSGGPFRNLKGTNLEGEWGVKGMYVDYKLVAKYGWKQLSFDTSFYNSARKAFYAGVVALDNANKATEGCSVSIPLRAELKPGYPVYIEENDCFYYVEGLNHNFSYGGECTTSLTLTAQRKKFIPPGRTDKKYSEDPAQAVDLGDTSLPEKYIYTTNSRTNLNNEKVVTKKIVGFPNVVMALDPFKMDPGFLTFSVDYQSMGRLGTETRQAYRNMLLIEGKRYGVIKTGAGGDLFSGPWIVKIGDQEGSLGLEKEGTPYLTKQGKRVRTSKISRGQAESKSIILGESALEGATYQKVKAEEKAAKLAGKGKYSSTNEKERLKIIREAELRLEEAIDSLTTQGGAQASFTVYDLILAIRKAKGQEVEDGKINTSNLLRLLENKKNSFAPHLPGYYRYYSSSHPSREHQGPSIPTINPDSAGETPELRIDPPGIADPTDINMVESDPLNGKDNVVFSQKRGAVVAGLNTRTLYTSGFGYVPTKDIKTLTFQINQTLVEREVEVGLTFDPSRWERGGNYGNAFKNNVVAVLSRTIARAYKPSLTLGQLKKSVFKSRQRIPALYPSDFYFQASVLGDTKKLSAAIPNVTNKTVFARILASELYVQLFNALGRDFDDLYREWGSTEGARSARISALLSKAQKVFRPNIKGAFYRGTSRKEKIREFKNGKMVSPIFPVSDDLGYEVFGAYQYGRGLSPARNTLFDALLRQDPSKIFTQQQLKDLRDSLGDFDSSESFQKEYKRRILNRISEIYSTQGVEVVQRYYKAYGLDLDDESKDPTGGFNFQTLANAMMTRSDEQVIQNVPKTLAEIRPNLGNQAMCSCKGTTSEATLLYDAVNLEDSRVDIENPLVAEALRASRAKTPAWIEHQKALRAEGFGLSSNQKMLRSVIDQVGDAFNGLGNQTESIGEAITDLTDKEKYEDAAKRRGNS